MGAKRDTRRIQTAVLGHRDSDEPLVLPLEAFELDVFRHLYRGATFWCGVLLGGCGGRLATKLYTDRACHFAHYPGPDGALTGCSRTHGGVGSADHLYLKAATTAWLREQGRGAHFHFARHEGAPVGSVVDIDVDGGMQLRVHINGEVPVRWDPTGRTETVLGPGVRVEYETLARRRYVNRVRFYSDGPCRRIQIGTEALGRGTEWFALEDCTMAPNGLVTPVVAELRRRWEQFDSPRPGAAAPGTSDTAAGTAPAAAAASPAASDAGLGEVHRLVLRLGSAQRADNLAEVRELCTDGDHLLGRLKDTATRARLQKALSAAQRWQEQKDKVRQLVFARLQDAIAQQRVEDIRSVLQQAITLRGQGHHLSVEEEALIKQAHSVQHRLPRPGRTGWITSARSGSPADRTAPYGREPRSRSRTRGPQADAVPLPAAPRPPHRVERSQQELEAVARAVRGALRRTARQGGITSWHTLRRQLGSSLPRLTAPDQARVLLLVDRTTETDQPPLSTLLAAGDPDAVAAYRQSAANLGLVVPTHPDALRDVLDADTAHLHRLWRGR
ncbi:MULTISPECIES: hypothetical protein [unclassified Streptomyces]|uniref:hypothetical protein n=1 Tax=unclassified Streptomyces TaxID=2593676 RepID=UPI0009391A4C|nr:hypothetical protein [Streptomyces sp. TSRI0107]